jgi:long-chain acyl-CoA synthetase
LKSLTEHLKQEARRGSSVGRTLLQDNNGSLSLADVLERCDNLSNLLIREKFQFVALYGDNSCDWVTVDLACQQAAICLIPIPTFFSQKQISHVFNTVAIDLVIGDSVEAFIAASGLPID